MCQVLLILTALALLGLTAQGGHSNPSSPHSPARKRPRLDLNKLPNEQQNTLEDSFGQPMYQNVPLDGVQGASTTSQVGQVPLNKQLDPKAAHRYRTARWYAGLTPEQKKERQRRNAERAKIRFANMPDEKKIEYRKRRNKDLINFRSKKTPEELRLMASKHMKTYRAKRKLKKLQQPNPPHNPH
ncbi:uncharacterized protein FA14DRAFT_154377 [Meira miltonrushii]|uniref:Uncharacterized protein n=1 Tax=Meira miltonrushii TaxID=1280837 RepID=A0A316VG13_9BASI|nr:uncharacterized protein FA14DRAFT_154377 [Meira miltonrushii]PWN34941.1 hypothetical protein FA14DRAFT_154377 [Meira miltonrushii]